jgi:hypothetical protein
MASLPTTTEGAGLVWNKGIAALCDRRIPDEFPDGQNYTSNPTLAGAEWSRKLPENLIANPEPYFDLREGEVIWVRLSWLKSFVRQVLPFVRSGFKLVTGDSDSCVPSALPGEAAKILASARVQHWYTQNYDGSCVSQKISPIPIGIDFHMQAQGPAWGEEQASPLQQERDLCSIRDSLPPLGKRLPQVYLDFAWQGGFGLRHYRRFHRLTGTAFQESRRRLANKLKKNEVVYCQPAALPRREMWRKRGRYAFVLSPHGMGLDCHRTWEALALGHIVIVPSSSLDVLYEGLPVVILKSWQDLRPGNLKMWLTQWLDEPISSEKLTSSEWVDQIRNE